MSMKEDFSQWLAATYNESIDECACPLCSSQDEEVNMSDRYYQPCARCGDLAGRYAHMIAASNRLICGRCWAQLKFDDHGHKIDDLATPASLELEHSIKTDSEDWYNGWSIPRDQEA